MNRRSLLGLFGKAAVVAPAAALLPAPVAEAEPIEAPQGPCKHPNAAIGEVADNVFVYGYFDCPDCGLRAWKPSTGAPGEMALTREPKSYEEMMADAYAEEEAEEAVKSRHKGVQIVEL